MKKRAYFFILSLVITSCQNDANKSANNTVAQSEIKTETHESVQRAAKTLNKNKDAPITPFKRPSTDTLTQEPTRIEQLNEPTNVFFLAQNTVSSRKIIRTAQVKTKVKNTEGATYQIEHITQKWRGFVTANNLQNRIVKQEVVNISTDSMLQITHSEAVNTLIIRVPSLRLDTFLAELKSIYLRLDYRCVNANDLTSTFLTNQLKSEQREESARRIAAASDEKGKRLADIVNAETNRLQLSDESIEQKVQNEETDYNIAFCTVQIEIYEDPVITRNIVPYISPTITSARFSFRCQQALANGWSFLLNIFVGVLNMWAFILLAIVAYILYRRVAASIFSKFSLSRKDGWTDVNQHAQ
ncbi:MAG: DUF4349 domain-containing protein [Saprospiraceae bacterium]|nr:DUF4349 domain-containing protein [Saprospiraceae bacterium]